VPPVIGSTVRALALLALVTLAQAASARTPALDDWISHELTPYLTGRLSTYPLFKDGVLRFVVLDGENPVARSNALVLGLRDRLEAEAVDTPGLTVAWRSDDPAIRRSDAWSGHDCAAVEPDFLIGIEAVAVGPDDLHVMVRALDVAERRWVSGFGLEWRGRLGTRERRALQTPMADRSFLGERGVPFGAEETDRLAARLARDLDCALMRQVSGDYVFAPAGDGDDPTGRIAALVEHNVAGTGRLRFATTPEAATARLETSAVRIDDSLYQYWVRVVPTGTDAGLLPVSVSAYVELSPYDADRGLLAVDAASIALPKGDLLQDIRLVRLNSGNGCGARQPGYVAAGWHRGPESCAAIEVATREDAVVFLLNHQPNHGLVRIGDGTCRQRTAARIARAGEPLRLPLPADVGADSWSPSDQWLLDPAADTYYAIAISDSNAARELARMLDRLPQRCSDSLRVGFEGRQLDRWLGDLGRDFARWQADADWRAVSVREVY